MEKYARHGDLVIDKLSDTEAAAFNFKPVTNFVIAGSSSSPHTVRGTIGVARDGGGTYLDVPEPTVLDHSSRHEPIPLEAGKYRVGPLRERGGEGDRAVED